MIGFRDQCAREGGQEALGTRSASLWAWAGPLGPSRTYAIRLTLQQAIRSTTGNGETTCGGSTASGGSASVRRRAAHTAATQFRGRGKEGPNLDTKPPR